jgi:hypothetical protein
MKMIGNVVGYGILMAALLAVYLVVDGATEPRPRIWGFPTNDRQYFRLFVAINLVATVIGCLPLRCWRSPPTSDK